MSKVPAWLRKPNHKEEVVASDKGWIVKRTGELLVRVPRLKDKLAEYLGMSVSVEPLVEESLIPVESQEQKVEENTEQKIQDSMPPQAEEAKQEVEQPVQEETQAPEQTEAEEKPAEEQPKRRGRKPKNQSA